LEPFLQNEIERLSKGVNCKLEVFGKDLISEVSELKPEAVNFALAKVLGKKISANTKFKNPATLRLPQLCPGCPYWLVVSGVKKGLGDDFNKTIFGGEIGCYMLFGYPPINMQDYLFCMGSSIGIAHGIKKAIRHGSGQNPGQKLVTFIGDSSFFHSGIPALVNAVWNKSNPLVIILNNETTAMTGHQPHPVSVGSVSGIKIEDVVRSLGVKYVKTLDPVNQEEFAQTVKEFSEKEEVAVIVSAHPCKFVNK
jgi:indolepyruvate ferredoxin oxidoreductase alpha subunit